MRVTKQSITFEEALAPITEPVTKFGGQPVWREAPKWPLSRATGKPMRFICQVATDAAMAYLFMTDLFPEYGDEHIDGTWEAEGGENAVVLQPGEPPPVETAALTTGPTLYRMVEGPDPDRLVPEPCEYGVQLTLAEDSVAEEDWDSRFGNKLDGVPGFVQAPEYPLGEDAHLLLQVDSADVPFFVNFGDAGVGYVFVSPDARCGRFVWQCS
jgi:uncharacterized protein YwqG